VEQEWVVVVEGICTPARFDLAALRRLLQRVEQCSPSALQASDRCALQLHVTAASSSDALTLALEQWDLAVRDLAHLDWKVVRAEVMTVDEFARDCAAAYGESDAAWSAGPRGDAPDVPHGEALLRRAFEDALTGMETPGIFAHRLEQAAARARQAQGTSAVVVLDLDGFKAVNQRSGTEAGDQLLAAVAQRLLDALGGGGKAARVGGDRFAALLESASEATAVATAERFLDAVRRPFHLEDGSVALTASVGVAVGPTAHAESLLDNANAALLAAKISNRGGLHLFDPACGDAAASGATVGPRSQLGASLLLLRRAAVAAESPTLAEAAATVLPEVHAYAGWPLGQLCLFDAVAGGFRPTATWYASEPDRFRAVQDAATRSPAPVGADHYRRVIAGQRPEWTPDLEEGFLTATHAARAGLRAVVVVPVLAGNQVVAALQFFVEDRQEPDAAVLETLSLVGVHLGQVALRTSICRPVAHTQALPSPTGSDEPHRRGTAATPSFVPFRYELFGWGQ
jgi:diguanylate cyclase (GGDEF)-like protein